MRLHEIKPLNESVTPIHILMILKEICAAEKCTNTIHTILLSQLIERFKYGSKVSIRYLSEFPSNKEILDTVRELKCKEQCQLAQFFLQQLMIDEWSEQFVNPKNSLIEWINFVIKKQD